MRQTNLYNIKLNQIQIFLATVEYNSFSKAAEALHFTQPMVSKTIQTIEQEFGIILFLRKKGRLQLTPAGRELYVHWKNILQYFEDSLTEASRIQEGRKLRLKIGVGSLTTDEQALFVSEQIRKKNSSISLQIEYQNIASGIQMLLTDQLDAFLLSKHAISVQEIQGLCYKTVLKTHLAVFVPDQNPLYFRESDQIDFRELKKESFISFSQETDNRYLQLLSRLAGDAGFIPKISCYVPNEMSFKINLRLNNGIVLADDSTNLKDEHIRMFTLPKERNDVILIWKQGIVNNTFGPLFSSIERMQ